MSHCPSIVGGGVSVEPGGSGGISRFHCFPTVLPVFSFLPPVDSALQFSTGCLGESLQSSGREEKVQQSIRLLVWCEGMLGSQLGGTEVGVKLLQWTCGVFICSIVLMRTSFNSNLLVICFFLFFFFDWGYLLNSPLRPTLYRIFFLSL